MKNHCLKCFPHKSCLVFVFNSGTCNSGILIVLGFPLFQIFVETKDTMAYLEVSLQTRGSCQIKILVKIE